MGKLRDQLLEEGLTKDEYFDNSKQSYSQGLGIKSEAKKKKVATDIYQTGLLEKQVREEVKDLLKKFGFKTITIYTGGIILGNRLIKNPAKGFPDQYVIDKEHKKVFYVELKRNSGGYLSIEQQSWIADLEACGQLIFVVTSAKMLEVELRKMKLI